MDRGDRVEAVLGELDEHGKATADVRGVPLLVAGGIPGERVEVEIVRRFPESLAARVTSVLAASPARVAPPCPYYLTCTGCQFQHIAYERQLEIKRNTIAKALERYPVLGGASLLPGIASPRRLGYRNHARFTIGKREEEGAVGFVNADTRRFVRIERCLLMDDAINGALSRLQGRAQGMTQASVRAGSRTGSVMVQPKLPAADIGLDSGQFHFVESVMGRRFQIAASSFFQVNTEQAEAVVDLLRVGLRLSGRELLVDAYCGVGLFAILLAPHARRVIGIEEAGSAIADARENAVDLPNLEFVEARTEAALDSIGETFDALILDPPRAGCSSQVIETVNARRPARVAMVSCEPATMARDLAALCSGPYIVETVQPVDMFPQTRHVEAIAVLRCEI